MAGWVNPPLYQVPFSAFGKKEAIFLQTIKRADRNIWREREIIKPQYLLSEEYPSQLLSHRTAFMYKCSSVPGSVIFSFVLSLSLSCCLNDRLWESGSRSVIGRRLTGTRSRFTSWLTNWLSEAAAVLLLLLWLSWWQIDSLWQVGSLHETQKKGEIGKGRINVINLAFFMIDGPHACYHASTSHSGLLCKLNLCCAILKFHVQWIF